MPKSIDEKIESYGSDIDVKETTGLGEAMQALDNVGIDPKTGLSMVDLNCRLTPDERKLMALCDEVFTSLGIESSITFQLKRLSVSLGGLGREEKVRVIQGERANANGTSGVKDFFGGLFKGRGGRLE